MVRASYGYWVYGEEQLISDPVCLNPPSTGTLGARDCDIELLGIVAG